MRKPYHRKRKISILALRTSVKKISNNHCFHDCKLKKIPACENYLNVTPCQLRHSYRYYTKNGSIKAQTSVSLLGVNSSSTNFL